MALVERFVEIKRKENRPDHPVRRATLSIERDLVVIRTYGSETRECTDRPSQILHLTPAAVDQLLTACLGKLARDQET